MAIDKLGQNAIADGSVDTAQLADDSVNSAKIGVDVIAAEDLAANSVTVTEISNGAVTLDKLSATGTKDATTFLRGDNTFATPATPTLTSLGIDNHDQVTVDSNGVITTGVQPTFHASCTNAPGNSFGGTSPTKYPFNNAHVNIGSGLDLTNNRFVAPKTGQYYFHWHALFRNISSGGRAAFYINGTKWTQSSNGSYSDLYCDASHEVTVGMDAVFSLTANDYVEVFVWMPTGDCYGGANGHNGFTGHLIS